MLPHQLQPLPVSRERDVPKQSEDRVWKNPGAQVSHLLDEDALVIHPAAQVHRSEEVHVPCTQSHTKLSVSFRWSRRVD